MILITLLHTNFFQNHILDVLHSDLNMYFYELNSEKINVKVMKIHNVWRRNLSIISKQRLIVKIIKIIELLTNYFVRRIQIILKLTSISLQILLNFDLDACALAFNDREVLMLSRCARALKTEYNVFIMSLVWDHYLERRKESRLQRILKYANREFEVRILLFYVRFMNSSIFDEAKLSTVENESR